MSAHGFRFDGIEGDELALSNFEGRPVLVVNTASECGFTPQYADLQRLWETYGPRGLVVLGVPSNDFGGQEPGTEAEIRHFCESRFRVGFPMTAKARVAGGDAHPFYRWVVEQAGEAAGPSWNFHKILLDGAGELAGVWPSKVKPSAPEVTEAIEACLAG